MNCPKCGDGTRIIDCRDTNKIADLKVKLSTPAVRRRHDCRCGHRFTTYEYLVVESPEFKVSVLEMQVDLLRKQVDGLLQLEATR